MRLRSIAFGLACLLFAAPALAASESVDLSSGQASFIGTSPLLDGGSDTITFTGLAAGTYNFVVSLSGQYLTGLTATLNGQALDVTNVGNITFAGLEGVSDAPFVLELTGTLAGAQAAYSGELSVTLVPEPGTLALLMLGIGILVRAPRAS
jgi:hypothetical protein